MINAYPQPTNTAPTFPPAETPSATPQAPQKKGLFSSFTKKTWYLIGGLVALIILVGGSSAGLYLAQINSENRPAAGLSCPGGTCPDGWSYGPDTDAPQSSCAQRAIDACVGHGGSSGTPTGGSNTCDSSQTTAAACRGKNVGDHVAGTCTCFRTTGTLCGCRADTAPTNPPTTGGTGSQTCADARGTAITSGPDTGKCRCSDGSVVTQSGNCPVDKGSGGTKTIACAGAIGTCRRTSCTSTENPVTNATCSGREDVCCKPKTATGTGGSGENTASCASAGGTCARNCAAGQQVVGSATCSGREDVCCRNTRTCSSIGATDITSGADTGKCRCPGGLVVTQSGTCPAAARTCASIGANDITSGANTGKCLCPNGSVVTQSGTCSTAARTCASIGATDITSGANTGKCLCPGGSVTTQSGTCTAAKTCASIGATNITTGADTGKCRCPSGNVVTQQGSCSATIPGSGSTGGTGTGTGTGGTGTGGTGTGTGGTGTTSGAMCPNSPTTPIKKYIKFTCPNGCTVTTEGGVTAARCYENRVESTSPLTLGANECGQVDALSGDSDSTYCGYTQYRCDGSCGGGGGNPSPSPKTPEYSCNSLCTTNAQCRGENDQLRCVTVANGSKRCRLNGNEASTKCQPAVGPQCLAIRLRKADGITPIKFGENDPKLGESVTLLCGKVDAAARYIFRVVDPDGDRTRLESTGQVSAPFKIEKAGKYTAQCQICTGDSNDTCLPFESLND